jgi:6-phosphogluconolactonase
LLGKSWGLITFSPRITEMNLTVEKYSNSSEAINHYIWQVIGKIKKSFSQNRDFHLLVTGGSSGTDFGNELGRQLTALAKTSGDFADSSATLHLWWSDERFEELDSPDRSDSKILGSYTELGEKVFAHLSLPPSAANIEKSATALAAEIGEFLLRDNFDFAILGFGNDGHLASCFPGEFEVLRSNQIVLPITNSPKPPAQRTTFTLARLAKSDNLVILALGPEKKNALADTLAGGGSSPVEILASLNPNLQVIIATDQAV